MLLVFNKTDVSRHEFALDWMADFETFHVALQADSSYASTLSKSLSLVGSPCTIALSTELAFPTNPGLPGQWLIQNCT